MEKSCVICDRITDSDTSAILTIGGFGNPKYICSDCEADIDTATHSTDTKLIYAAMERVAKSLSDSNSDDELVIETVSEIFDKAKARAEMIKTGTYDFSLDSITEEDGFELTEEYAETEEDKELTRKEEEERQKEDKISFWITIGMIIGAVGFLVYKLIDIFFIK